MWQSQVETGHYPLHNSIIVTHLTLCMVELRLRAEFLHTLQLLLSVMETHLISTWYM